MPKYLWRDKKSRPQNRGKRGSVGNARAVKDLLSSSSGLMESVAMRADAEAAWRARLATYLPAALAKRITGIVANEAGDLVVFTESAAWSARLRYALGECEAELRLALPSLRRIEVKVLPALSRAGARIS